MLVLSYLILHNIYIVIIGMIFAFYKVNKVSINKYIESEKYNKNIGQESEKDIIDQKNSIIKEEQYKKSTISLVETIEETGFIPSLYSKIDNKINNDDINAA